MCVRTSVALLQLLANLAKETATLELIAFLVAVDKTTAQLDTYLWLMTIAVYKVKEVSNNEQLNKKSVK